MKISALLSFLVLLISFPAFSFSLEDCEDEKECVVDLPGAVCADGSQSYFTLTKRKDAKNLMVYLSGGGACWSKSSCQNGYAENLTRVEPNNDWNNGPGIQNSKDSNNPFAKGFNVVTVPYCTGDVHAGNRTTNYGSSASPYTVRHVGYNNIQLILKQLKEVYPEPEKAVLFGCSAGGIGAYYHLENFKNTFPDSQQYVISDAGTPFKPPYLYKTNYENIMKNWGADKTLPTDLDGDQVVKDFGTLIEYNTTKFPDVKFALLSSYRDFVMTFFALSVGSPSPFTAVKKIIIDVADNSIGADAPGQKVYYIENSKHCHSEIALGSVSSMGKTLGTWLEEMLNDRDSWKNIRPDLNHYVQSAADAIADPRPRNINELNQLKR